MDVSRREWMLASACWAEILRAQTRKFVYVDEVTAAEIDAIARQIIPDDDTPGAGQAGVIWFIDGSLAGYDSDKRDLYTRGLADTQAKRTQLFPGSTSIGSLTSEQQIDLLKAIERTEFFAQVRFHTVLGFFGHPMHGGNREMLGWKHIGIEHVMQFRPPFGYYDAASGKESK